MQTDFINEIKPTPTFKTRKCKIISLLLKIALQYTALIVGITVWYVYDYFIAGATFLMAFLVMGIVKSYLRNSVIPQSQQEFNYNDEGIANWYTARELCIEIPSKHSLQKSED